MSDKNDTTIQLDDELQRTPIVAAQEAASAGPRDPADAPPRGPAPSRGVRILKTVLFRYSLVLVWLAMAGVFAVLTPSTFLTQATVTTIFGSHAVLVMLTFSLLVTLNVGEFDLSCAAAMGWCAALIATLNAWNGWPIGLAVLFAVAVGAAVGWINGLLVVRLGVDAIIETLGMSTLLTGLSLLITNSVIVGGVSSTIVDVVSGGTILSLPYSFYYGVLGAALLWYVFSHTPLGRNLLFVGRSREVSRLAGIRVERARWGAFVASGAISGVAGVVLVGTLGSYQAAISANFLLPAFTAAFLGVTTIEPGRFNAWGSLIAIYFLITGITGLALLGLTGWVQQTFYGAALIVAITLSTIVRRRSAELGAS